METEVDEENTLCVYSVLNKYIYISIPILAASGT